MKVSVFGCELSGLVTAGALAQTGNQVVALPIGGAKVEALRKAEMPRDEPGLKRLIKTQLEEGRLTFEEDWRKGVEHADVLILSVPSWHLGRVEEVVNKIGHYASGNVLVVNQSSFPIGTADRFEASLRSVFVERGLKAKVSVVAMPEFISEGSALNDFTKPDRIVLGSNDAECIQQVKDLMRPYNRMTDRFKVMSTRAAEYTKYAVNALLATRISLVNELANNAEHFDIDIEEVRQGLGSDSRIGFSYLYPGCGFGGPSFASDVMNLVETLEEKGYDADLLKTVLSNNETQKEVLFRKAWRFFNTDLKGKKVAIWGLSFKPNTSTVENAPSLRTIEALTEQGAEVNVYDPKAMPDFEAKWAGREGVHFFDDMYSALEGVDALFLMTEWKTFWSPDYPLMKSKMKAPVMFDGRNIYDKEVLMAQGFRYFGVGRGERV